MMKIMRNPHVKEWHELVKRPLANQLQLFERAQRLFDDIATRGDKAVSEYSYEFDSIYYTHSPVDLSALDEAASRVNKPLQEAMEVAYNNIKKFHNTQVEQKVKTETMQGVTCWRESRAIETVGIYIPGGSAPLFSTVLMLGVPAKIAGCKQVVLCTPPNREGKIDPAILYAAHRVGINKVYALGGMQAIAAMALGTESIPKVDKIFGPGNQYVTAAKQVAQLYGTAIDMPAGPSEVLIIADDSCDAEFVAADLLSQAEHGPDSQVFLLTNSNGVIKQVNDALQEQLDQLGRRAIAESALGNSKAIYFESIATCIEFSNCYAPEHLILATNNNEYYLSKIENAGSVFIGNYSCESIGDYASGTNHTLPTNGYARAYSGVSVDSFVKKITFQSVTREGLMNIGKHVEVMAQAEHLMAHKNAVTIRLNKIEKEQ